MHTQAKFRTMVTKEVSNERETTMNNGNGYYTDEEMRLELKWSKSRGCIGQFALPT